MIGRGFIHLLSECLLPPHGTPFQIRSHGKRVSRWAGPRSATCPRRFEPQAGRSCIEPPAMHRDSLSRLLWTRGKHSGEQSRVAWARGDMRCCLPSHSCGVEELLGPVASVPCVKEQRAKNSPHRHCCCSLKTRVGAQAGRTFQAAVLSAPYVGRNLIDH